MPLHLWPCHWTNVVPIVDTDIYKYVGACIVDSERGTWSAYRLAPTENLFDTVNEGQLIKKHLDTPTDCLKVLEQEIAHAL